MGRRRAGRRDRHAQRARRRSRRVEVSIAESAHSRAMPGGPSMSTLTIRPRDGSARQAWPGWL